MTRLWQWQGFQKTTKLQRYFANRRHGDGRSGRTRTGNRGDNMLLQCVEECDVPYVLHLSTNFDSGEMQCMRRGSCQEGDVPLVKDLPCILLGILFVRKYLSFIGLDNIQLYIIVGLQRSMFREAEKMLKFVYVRYVSVC